MFLATAFSSNGSCSGRPETRGLFLCGPEPEIEDDDGCERLLICRNALGADSVVGGFGKTVLNR